MDDCGGAVVPDDGLGADGGQHRMAQRVYGTAAERAYEVSKEVMQNSSSTYLEVLTAQQSLLQSRLTLTTDRFDLIQGSINLFKALGGEIP